MRTEPVGGPSSPQPQKGLTWPMFLILGSAATIGMLQAGTNTVIHTLLHVVSVVCFAQVALLVMNKDRR